MRGIWKELPIGPAGTAAPGLVMAALPFEAPGTVLRAGCRLRTGVRREALPWVYSGLNGTEVGLARMIAHGIGARAALALTNICKESVMLVREGRADTAIPLDLRRWFSSPTDPACGPTRADGGPASPCAGSPSRQMAGSRGKEPVT